MIQLETKNKELLTQLSESSVRVNDLEAQLAVYKQTVSK